MFRLKPLFWKRVHLLLSFEVLRVFIYFHGVSISKNRPQGKIWDSVIAYKVFILYNINLTVKKADK